MRFPPLWLALSVLAFACQNNTDTTGTARRLPPEPDPAATAIPGIRSLTVGSEAVEIRLRLPDRNDVQIALFQGNTRGSVYNGAPIVEAITSERVAVANQTNGVTTYFGIGIRDLPLVSYTPTGLVVEARPNEPIFVDETSAASSPDGKTPATAFRTVVEGIDEASKQGGGNVWVREGRYEARHVVPVGVHVFGGFGVDFDLASRRVGDSGTVLTAPGGETVVVAGAGSETVVLDGVTVDGEEQALTGIDAGSSPLELRSVGVRDLTGDGIYLHEEVRNSVTLAQLLRCTIAENRLNGVRVNGAFDLRIDTSILEGNGDDGVRLDDLFAPEQRVARFQLTSSLVAENEERGLTVDLASPEGVLVPGSFEFVIRGVDIACNRDDGMFLNPTYEPTTDWRTSFVLRESTVRGNGGNGIEMDAFGQADTFLHRMLVTANSLRGMYVTSYRADSELIVVSASVFSGNGGEAIVNTHPQKSISVSHSILASNFGGGFVTQRARGYVTSSIDYQQINPYVGTTEQFSTGIRDPGQSGFVNIPSQYMQVVDRVGQQITIAGVPPSFGNLVELADDNVARLITARDGNSIEFERPLPECLRVPSLLSVFFGGGSVAEDYRLTFNSPALFVGMAPPQSDPVEAGVYGAPDGGEPGVADYVPHELFRVRQIDAKLDRQISGYEELEFEFSHEIDPRSVGPLTVRAVTDVGAAVPMTREIAGRRLTLRPNTQGWAQRPFSIQLHAGLRAAVGPYLSTPIAIPVRTIIR